MCSDPIRLALYPPLLQFSPRTSAVETTMLGFRLCPLHCLQVGHPAIVANISYSDALETQRDSCVLPSFYLIYRDIAFLFTMANTLIGLSNDLKLDVHTQLEDLDDALHSSQTCKVFHGKKAMIQKQVIVSISDALNSWRVERS